MNEAKSRCGMPWSILYSKKLTENEKLVFIALKDRAYQQDKTCTEGFYCYIDWLAANLQMSNSTVKRAIKGLKEKKIIDAQRVKLHKKVVNLWTINWEIIDKANKQFKFAEIEYEEVDVIDDTPMEQMEIKTVPVEEIIEDTKPTFSIVDDEEDDEPNMSEEIPIAVKVSQMFIPIYNNYCNTRDMNTFAKEMDKSIDTLFLIYQEYERDEIKELFKEELLKRKQIAA